MGDKKNELDEMLNAVGVNITSGRRRTKTVNEPNEKVTSLINAVGSLAETSAMLYHELITKGIPPHHACRMASAFIRATINFDSGGTDDE